MHTMACIPKLYEQVEKDRFLITVDILIKPFSSEVLHLMNKMNLPPPFGPLTIPPPNLVIRKKCSNATNERLCDISRACFRLLLPLSTPSQQKRPRTICSLQTNLKWKTKLKLHRRNQPYPSLGTIKLAAICLSVFTFKSETNCSPFR